uniref:Uncharacterized protein n=1 Tax=Anopheles culicifacies TaxID=139723 RepID=A0A182MWY2_9DIPT
MNKVKARCGETNGYNGTFDGITLMRWISVRLEPSTQVNKSSSTCQNDIRQQITPRSFQSFAASKIGAKIFCDRRHQLITTHQQQQQQQGPWQTRLLRLVASLICLDRSRRGPLCVSLCFAFFVPAGLPSLLVEAVVVVVVVVCSTSSYAVYV